MILLWIFIIPSIAALAAFSLSSASKKAQQLFAFTASLLPLALMAYNHTDIAHAEINYPWFPSLDINFHLAIDGISSIFIYLTLIVIPISILAVSSDNFPNSHVFYALVLLLEGLLIGFFSSQDLAFFTFFYEAMLIPLYFIMSAWGGPDRQRAALKFIIYMVAGSALMVAAVLGLYFNAAIHSGHGTFDIRTLAASAASSPYALPLAAVFLLAFAVKTPLFPFHAWLPDAYYQASTPGSILLAGILSKAGIYGIIRVIMTLFPHQLSEWHFILLILAAIGVFYGGFCAWVQNDFKRLIAYSSFSHVNFILLGLFALQQIGETGTVLQSFNHGITISALFLVSGWLEQRIGTTAISPLSGMAKFLPHLCWLTLFFVLAAAGLPGLNNFIGELLILYGVFVPYPWLAAILCLSVILSVMYLLRWMQKVYFESPGFFQEQWQDIRVKEFLIAIPLAALILWLGLYPSPLIKQIESSAIPDERMKVAELSTQEQTSTIIAQLEVSQ